MARFISLLHSYTCSVVFGSLWGLGWGGGVGVHLTASHTHKKKTQVVFNGAVSEV